MAALRSSGEGCRRRPQVKVSECSWSESTFGCSECVLECRLSVRERREGITSFSRKRTKPV